MFPCYFIILYKVQHLGTKVLVVHKRYSVRKEFLNRNQIKSADGLHTTQQTGTCFLLIVTINSWCRDVKQPTADARIRKFGGDFHIALNRKMFILLQGCEKFSFCCVLRSFYTRLLIHTLLLWSPKVIMATVAVSEHIPFVYLTFLCFWLSLWSQP